MTQENTNAPEAAPQDTWAMACAVLTALHQTYQKAQADYRQQAETSANTPFAPGMLNAGHMIETLRPSLRVLQDDMR